MMREELRVGIDGRYIRDDFPGIGRYVYSLTRALLTLAPDVDVILFYDPDAPNSRYDLAALNCSNLTLVPIAIAVRSVVEQIRLPSLARRLSISVFHSPYYITAYRMPCRQIVTIYDVISAHYPEYLPSLGTRLIFEVTTRLALRTADHVLTLSEVSQQDLTELYRVDPNRITVTPLAADSRFQPAEVSAISEMKRRLDLPDRYVLYVGINKPHKNLERLVDAWALVVASMRIDCHLVLAGREDPRYPQARDWAAALGLDSVMFLGAIREEDLPILYSGAELFVFPSLYEGFGLPVIEAMACGTPVVCSNASSLPEVAGDAALLFDPTDVSAIATSIQHALTDADLRARLEVGGLEQAERFSWERTARLTLAAYRAV